MNAAIDFDRLTDLLEKDGNIRIVIDILRM